MSALSKIALTLCYVSVAVSVISLFLPQKRTRKIFSFVIGLFVIASFISCFRELSVGLDELQLENIAIPQVSAEDYNEAVIQETADNLVEAADELLRSEGIEARDIQLSLKISDEGRIYVNEIVIYIGEADLPRKSEIDRFIYENFMKEPRVYVEKEEVE